MLMHVHQNYDKISQNGVCHFKDFHPYTKQKSKKINKMYKFEAIVFNIHMGTLSIKGLNKSNAINVDQTIKRVRLQWISVGVITLGPTTQCTYFWENLFTRKLSVYFKSFKDTNI